MIERAVTNRLAITINNADNQLVIFLNGQISYNRRTEQDPRFNDVVELTGALLPGRNILTIIGIDWGVRANYQGNVSIDNDNIPFSYVRDGTAASEGFAWHTSFVLHT